MSYLLSSCNHVLFCSVVCTSHMYHGFRCSAKTLSIFLRQPCAGTNERHCELSEGTPQKT